MLHKDYNQHHQVLSKVLTDHFDKDSQVTGIEIGTYCGDSGRTILWALPQCKLYTIDPWLHMDGHGFEAGEPQPYHDKNKELAYSRLYCDDFKDRVEILEMSSQKAHHLLTQERGIEKVDFVWIDGNHEVDGFISDLELFGPMVKEGGILGGHDFLQVWPLSQVILDRFGSKLWSGPDFAWWVYK